MKNLILVLLLLLVGCERTTKDATTNFILPTGMEDCKVYSMSNGRGIYITVVRCPNSSTSTSYSCGKTTCNASVIDI